MSFPHCSCKCGNVQIKGCIVPFHVEAKNQHWKEDSSKSQNLFLIHAHTINVQNKKLSIKSIKKGNVCEFIKCCACNTTFKFHHKSEKIIMEKVYVPNARKVHDNEQSKMCQSDDETLNKTLFNNVDDKYINNDSDFELMFSNKYDPFVGSYSSCNFSFVEGLMVNDSDFSQMSYNA